jgi:hypothetical protein
MSAITFIALMMEVAGERQNAEGRILILKKIAMHVPLRNICQMTEISAGARIF